MIATLFFTFFSGAGSASAAGTVSAKATKPKRRKFTFENGITVWATSEAMARLVAGMETAPPEVPPLPVEAIPIRPKRAKAVATTRPAAAVIAEQARVVIELRAIEARLRRLRADEEAIILHLLMDEAA